MNKLIFIFLILAPNYLFAQGGKIDKEPIIFEQVALDYFVSNILHKKIPFEDLKVYYDGKVDSSISPLAFSCIEDKMYKNPENEEVYNVIGFENNASGNYWRFNKKTPFTLKVNKPIKKYSPRIFASKHRTRKMKIYQNKNVSENNFVWINLYRKKKWGGESIYIIMDNKGLVKDWCFSSFVH